MSLNPTATPIQSPSGSILLYCDWPQIVNETPLTVDMDSSLGERPLLVHPDVIRTYQRAIFELQIQVRRYQVMVEQFTRRSRAAEERINDPSPPLNPASAYVIGSIIAARIPEESILRAFEE